MRTNNKPQISKEYYDVLKNYVKDDRSDIHAIQKRKIKELSTKKKPTLESKKVHRSG